MGIYLPGLIFREAAVADFYKNKDQMSTINELNALYNLNLPQNQLAKIHNSINTAKNELTSVKINWQPRPHHSLITKIALKQQKGCRSFYVILSSTPGELTSLSTYEAKWNLKLDQTLPIAYWKSVWELHANIQLNNKFKWLQCQILRYGLYTNNRVSKFKAEVSELCDLCNMHIENPLTLFWECQVAQQFWSQVRIFLAGNTFHLPDSRLGILFGFPIEPWNSLKNTAVMIGKLVIWKAKIKKHLPTLTHFKRSLKCYLVMLKYCSSIDSDRSFFDKKWDSVFSDLEQDGSDLSEPD